MQQLVRKKCADEEIDQPFALIMRKELRELTGWSEFQLRTHLNRLEIMEYVRRRYGCQGKRCAYELLVDAHEKHTVSRS